MAENLKQGDIGTKLREGQAVTETARIAADNQKALNKQKAEIALSTKELEIIRSGLVVPLADQTGSVEVAEVDITCMSGSM